MLRFKEYSEEFDIVAETIELSEDEQTTINEVMDTAGRLKKRRQFINRKSRLQLARKMQAHRLASQDRIKQRAHMRARNILIKRLYHGRSRSEIPLPQRQAVDTKLNRLRSTVDRMSYKLIRRVKRDDIRRKTHAVVGDVKDYGIVN